MFCIFNHNRNLEFRFVNGFSTHGARVAAFFDPGTARVTLPRLGLQIGEMRAEYVFQRRRAFLESLRQWQLADIAADAQQAALNVARDAFGKKYLMIGALKQGIAIYANDPVWATVRPPLVALTAEQAKSLEAELKAINFTRPGLKRAGAAVAA